MNSVIKIKKVYPRKNYILECEFENGIKKEYNLKLIIDKYEIFKKLETDEELDLAVEELWENGKVI